jgi:hypothetical protein
VRPRLAVQIASIVVALAAMETPASTQGFFDWFNQRHDDRYTRQNSWSGQRQEWSGQQQRQYTPQANAYSDPAVPMDAPRYGAPSTPSIGGGGRYVAYCVRLCDGRHFPMERHSNATSIQLCNAFCPAAKTQVFNGSQIDHAVAANGARYANLENAFIYRQKIVPGCTCNGRDAFGLAKIDVASDPTLKAGDIVATGDNQKAALAAAANRKVGSTVTANAALRGSKAKSADPDTQERPED